MTQTPETPNNRLDRLEAAIDRQSWHYLERQTGNA